MTRQMLKVAAVTMVLGAAWLAGARAQDKPAADKKTAEAAM